MSLLLDALKRTEPDSGVGLESDASLPPEEPLDGPATLALLVSKPIAQTALSLVPTSDMAASLPVSTPEPFSPGLLEPTSLEPSPVEPGPVEPGTVGSRSEAPEPVERARADPTPERVSPIVAARAAEAAPVPKPAAAATVNARASVTAPSEPSRAKAYALACAALAVLAAVGMVGRSLWWPGTSAVGYPAVNEAEQTPPDAAQPAAPSVAAVQVPSARPTGQFADAGYAPEIALRNADPSASASPPPSATFAARRGKIARAPIATLSVTQSEGPSPIDRRVQAGYEALSQGNLASAQSEYLAALALDPNNVDALMGAATVAARDGRAKEAAASYTKVLKLEPGNPDATAAMAALGADGSTGENEESRLKILIASGDGGRPALHAALAGVYAADLRWSEAAQEYFTALAKDPGNPDLAFNVAASLDQNRNPGMALAYYGQALIFARQRPTRIDLHAIEQRMSQLQAHVGTSPAPETP